MSRQLRWGILGTASICERMIPAIVGHSGSCLTAVASRTGDRARTFAARYGIPAAFASYDALISSGDVDAVYIPLPNSLHREWAVRSLEAGLHVLCEKPLALDVREAEEIEAAARRSGRVVVEAFMYRHHPVYTRLFELLDSGLIGSVVAMDSVFSFLLDEPGSIVDSAELGGGALADVGCYCINLSRRVAGCEPSRVEAASVGAQVDDSMTGILQFPNGVLARFFTSIRSAERHQAVIQGTTGSFVLDSPWHPGDDEASIRLQRHGQEDRLIRVAGSNSYSLQVADFVDACTGRSSPRWPVQDAVANLRVMDALRLSSRKSAES